MNYIENIYICLAAPVLITIFCLQETRRRMVFFFAGMTVCLLSSYISTFLALVQQLDFLTASLTIVPVVEEVMKFLPFLFYLLVFEPDREKTTSEILMIAVGFATFENVCYMTQNGAAQALQLLIRGFGTGTMHVVCGAIVGLGIYFLWDRIWIRAAGTMGLVSLAITYHSIYNLLVSQTGIPALTGFLIPSMTVVLYSLFGRRLLKNSLRRQL